MNRHALFYWRRQFERRGAATVIYGYPSREPISDNARRFAAFIASLAATNVYILGHSLGGVLTLNLLARLADNNPETGTSCIRRAVLAGSPAGGSQAANHLAGWRYGRWMLGRTILALEQRPQFPATGGVPPVEIGVIAGTRSLGLGRLFGPLERPNDGTISVAETRVAGARDSVALPLSHSAMLLSSRLVGQAYVFFVTGHFDHDRQHADT
jgi:pimeloyl-ACP methyl ester carboxylesterase